MNEPGSASPDSGARSAGAPLVLGGLLLVAGLLVNLWYLTITNYDLGGDEAQYWDWSRHLDLSYYSKGPLVAYIIAGSRALLSDWSVRFTGSEVLAVRVPATLLFAITTAGIFVLGWVTTRRGWIALGAMAIAFTFPILGLSAVFMTTDAPLAAAWTWTLVFLAAALRTGRAGDWFAAGLLTATGILAKYTMVLIIPVVGLAMLLDRTARRRLHSPGPYVALLIGLCGFIPILIWNARHDWVSFRHVAGQAGVSEGTGLNPMGPVEFLLGQALAANVVWFLALIPAVPEFFRRPVSENETHDATSTRLLLAAMLTVFGVFLAFSFITKIQPNWAGLTWIPACVLLPMLLGRLFASGVPKIHRKAQKTIILGIAVGVAMGVVARRTEWLMPLFARLAKNAPPWELTPVAKYDPTARLRGWQELGERVGQQIDRLRSQGAEPIVLTDYYQLASELAFYTPGNPTVYCLQSALGDRLSQYDLWPNPISDPVPFLGRPCVYVGSMNHPELVGEAGEREGALEGLELVETVEYREDGHTVRVWPIATCRAFRGFDSAALPSKDSRF